MQLIIHEQIKPDNIDYKDCYKSYDVLGCLWVWLLVRISHSAHFVERKNYINGIENCWDQVKCY